MPIRTRSPRRCRTIARLRPLLQRARDCGCRAAGTVSRSRCARSSASRSASPRRARWRRGWRSSSAKRCRPDVRRRALQHLFPTPEALADADLTSIGLTRARADTVRTVARALLDGRVDFQRRAHARGFRRALGGAARHRPVDRALHRVAGAWASRCVSRRRPGAAEGGAASTASRMSAKALGARAEAWRPWRAYAVIHLWRDSMAGAAPRAAHKRRSPATRSSQPVRVSPDRSAALRARP